jgi:hydroxymethylpyrimidine/phosphomethylpyrimidine kinase
MQSATGKLPTVMVFAGLDPTGGAGLQADIEAIGSMGGHALPVITAITAQDTHDVKSLSAVSPITVIEQARAVLEDISVDAFKIGLTGSVQIIEAIHTIVQEFSGVPVVVDPVCASGAGTTLTDDEQLDALVSLVFPLATLVTPNTLEARLLAPEADSLNASAQQIMSYGCSYVLITGTDEGSSETVEHRLYSDMRQVQSFTCERLPGSYHGSGCTLASAIAALLAHGVEPLSATGEALNYTVETLRKPIPLGSGQQVPDRLYWARDKERR